MLQYYILFYFHHDINIFPVAFLLLYSTILIAFYTYLNCITDSRYIIKC